MDQDVTAIDLPGHMGDVDALLWSIEKDPLLRSTITSIHVLDRAPDRDRLLRRVELGTRRIPRLRQRVVALPLSVAPPRWEVDPHFDLHYHVRWMRAPGTGDPRELFDIAEPLTMQGFDRARPLWELVVVEGLADGRAALLSKIHHTITAGIGGRRLQRELLDAERHPAAPPEDGPLPAPPRARPRTDGERVVGAVADEIARQARGTGRALASALGALARVRRDPVGVANDATHTLGSVAHLLTPTVEPLSPLMTGRSLSVRLGRIALARGPLEAAAGLVKGNLEEALVAGLAGGLARYHRHHGYDDEVGALRLALPVVRTDGETPAAGRLAPVRFNLPVDVDEPLERLNAVRVLVERERSQPALALSAPLANLVNRLPTTATTALFGTVVRGIDVLAATVPAPAPPLFLAGAEVEAQMAFGPLAGAALSATSVVFGDQVDVGVAWDPAAVPDGDVLLDCLTDGCQEIIKLV